nr:YkgJ family cysteine cluster protein [Helicobacter cinaedi]
MQKASMNTDKDYPFSFENSACESCGGKCCVGDSGYVFVDIKEMQEIASFLGFSFESFTKTYVRKVGYRFSFIEKPYQNALACVFFDTDSKQCSIYAYRPKQCRTYPFWEAHKNLNKQDLQTLCNECKGIKIKEYV